MAANVSHLADDIFLHEISNYTYYLWRPFRINDRYRIYEYVRRVHVCFRIHRLHRAIVKPHAAKQPRDDAGHCDVLFIRVGNRSEEHTSELQSRENLVCRLLLDKKKSTGK